MFSQSDILTIAGIFIFFVVLYWFLLARFIFSIFDPFFFKVYLYFVFLSTSLFFFDVASANQKILFHISIFSFLFGAYFSSYLPKLMRKKDAPIPALDLGKVYSLVLMLMLIIFLANFYIFYNNGVAILMDNPTMSKGEVFNSADGGANGIVRRINWGVLNFALSGSILLFLVGYKRLQASIFLAIILLISVASGSKSSLLPFIFYACILSSHVNLKEYKMSMKLRKRLPYLAALSVGPVIYILNKEFQDGVLSALLFRLLASGDAMIYYYQPKIFGFFQEFNFFDFSEYVFNPILGFFRISEYTFPIGYQMVLMYNDYQLPFDAIVGPNLPFPVFFDIFFGIGGVVASFILGVLVIFSKMIFEKRQKSFFHIVFMSNIYMFSLAMVVDLQMVIGQLFDYIFIFFFVWLAYKFLADVSGKNS